MVPARLMLVSVRLDLWLIRTARRPLPAARPAHQHQPAAQPSPHHPARPPTPGTRQTVEQSSPEDFQLLLAQQQYHLPIADHVKAIETGKSTPVDSQPAPGAS